MRKESQSSGARDRSGSLGFGVGLRAQHFRHVLERPVEVDWFEIISENFIDSGGWPREVLARLTGRFPIVPHGVSLSIGSIDPLDMEYLQKLRELADSVSAPWVSDHLCWTTIGGHNSHDLLPLPYTVESLNHLSERVGRVQDFLNRPLALENPSSYLSFRESTFSEADFLTELCLRTGCGILLDVNNVYVCHRNHGWDSAKYLNALRAESVWQIHIAGHSDHGTHCVDTHVGPVPKPVWEIYLRAIELYGGTATLLEWDQDIPPFAVLERELEIARHIAAERSLPEGLADAVLPAADQAVSNPIEFLVARESPS